MCPNSPTAWPTDLESTDRVFLDDVVRGLSDTPKYLPCKYFYDERGSRLFDRICGLDEYYVTRCELEIMDRFAPEMARQIGPGAMLIEFGSGSSVKTRVLLDHLREPVVYVPVDISGEHLEQTASRLAGEYPAVEVQPVTADFTAEFELPVPDTAVDHKAVYFPGSTIGNFEPHEARQLLGRIAEFCGSGGGLLIGIDLKKDRDTIHAAYNDREGVTAEFNLNLLRRINRELDGDFCTDQFEHRAVYDEASGRVELGLVSLCSQTVEIAGETFEFEAGEEIRTEYSHKYDVEQFAEMAASEGLELHRCWKDELRRFAVLHFAVAS